MCFALDQCIFFYLVPSRLISYSKSLRTVVTVHKNWQLIASCRNEAIWTSLYRYVIARATLASMGLCLSFFPEKVHVNLPHRLAFVHLVLTTLCIFFPALQYLVAHVGFHDALRT